MTLLEYYKSGKTDHKYDSVIKDCFKYNIFKETPSKSYKKKFKNLYEVDYPELLSDLSPSLIKELKRTIKWKKDDEKFELRKREERAKYGYAKSDTWDIFSWFLDIMPKMLTDMRDNLHGNPMPLNNISQQVYLDENEKEESQDFKEWKETLEKMIFLLNEMKEETCSYKNPYEKEYFNVTEDFRKKYGFCGEKLKTEEQLKEEEEKGYSAWLTPRDFPDLYPEFRDLQDKYFNCEKQIAIYRDKCREKFFNMFSEHFWDLWD